jgi:hypothetical protein
LHKRIDFLVRIPYARGLRWVQDDASRGVVCCYKFYTDSKMRNTKSVFHTMNPNFAYAKQFTVKDVSQNFIDYLKSSALVIEVSCPRGLTAGMGQAGRRQGPQRPHVLAPAHRVGVVAHALRRGLPRRAGASRQHAVTLPCRHMPLPCLASRLFHSYSYNV